MKERLVDEKTGMEFIRSGNYYLANSSCSSARSKVRQMVSTIIGETQSKPHCRPLFEELKNSKLPEKNI